MHRMVIVAMNGVVPADVSIPYEVFSRVAVSGGRAGDHVRVCGVTKTVTSGPFGLVVRHGLEELSRADTVVLAGIDDISVPIPARLVQAVREPS
jgi:hypothetical protein